MTSGNWFILCSSTIVIVYMILHTVRDIFTEYMDRVFPYGEVEEDEPTTQPPCTDEFVARGSSLFSDPSKLKQ
jgi:hypothetical protein